MWLQFPYKICMPLSGEILNGKYKWLFVWFILFMILLKCSINIDLLIWYGLGSQKWDLIALQNKEKCYKKCNQCL